MDGVVQLQRQLLDYTTQLFQEVGILSYGQPRKTQMGFVLFFASTFPISSPSSMLGWLLMMGSCV